jgi:regulator of protease activity HflC (stomatin/prohibitin superfamily)
MNLKVVGVLGLVFLLVLVVGGMWGCTRIGAGHVGIEVNLAGSQRGVQDFTLKTGWVVYNPLATTVVEYPTYVQTAVWTQNPHEGHPNNEEITFTTKDSMVVSVDVNLSYSLLADRVPQFYVKFRSDDLDAFTHGFLRNVARDCFNEVAGKYAVEQIMGDNAPFLHDARACLQGQVSDIGVHIEQFGIIGAPRPPQQVIDSINAKVQAGQIALQKQNEVLQAQADASKRVAEAEGQAKATIAIANGEAEANRIRSASINENIIKWQQLMVTDRWIARWNGNWLTTNVGAGGSPTGVLLNIQPH